MTTEFVLNKVLKVIMKKPTEILSIDLGTSALKAGQYRFDNAGGMTLTGFAVSAFAEPLDDGNAREQVRSAMQAILRSPQISARKAVVAVTGQSAFMRFVELPPIDMDAQRAEQLVRYEIEQSIPFAMDEITWDFQLAPLPNGETEFMLAATRNQSLNQRLAGIEDAGVTVESVDYGPAALYNLCRALRLDNDGPALVVDIGCRSTTLAFVEDSRCFLRVLPYGSAVITQAVAKELQIPAAEAEQLKRRHGFVALGGAWEKPESEVATVVSVVSRNAMTRLHVEIKRSVSRFRSHYKGHRPQYVYLSGGGSIMPYTREFLEEKMRAQVHYLNPFKLTALTNPGDPDLAEVPHLFAQATGAALKASRECPVDINLTTEVIRQRRYWRSRRWTLTAAAAMWFILLFCIALVNHRKAELYERAIAMRTLQVDSLGRLQREIGRAAGDTSVATAEYQRARDILERRHTWTEALNAVQDACPDDVWLHAVRIAVPAASEPTAEASIFSNRRRVGDPRPQPREATTALSLTGTAVTIPGRPAYSRDATIVTPVNSSLAETFVQQLAANNRFSKTGTAITGGAAHANLRNVTHFVINAELATKIDSLL
jgi:type IV pilus assembly protein PilM